MGDWHSSLNRGPMCMARWSACMHHWLASLCGIIQMCSLQIMPCSRVLRQLAGPLVVANVPNPHVIILQQQAPAVRPALKDSSEQTLIKAHVERQGCNWKKPMSDCDQKVCKSSIVKKAAGKGDAALACLDGPCVSYFCTPFYARLGCRQEDYCSRVHDLYCRAPVLRAYNRNHVDSQAVQGISPWL